jgi:transcriptional regulator with XRE-family HTH domain
MQRVYGRRDAALPSAEPFDDSSCAVSTAQRKASECEMADENKGDSTKHPNNVDRMIGRRIKMRRNELGLNQQRLAQQIGVSYQQVQKYENGTDRVGASRLHAIAKALHSDISIFFEPDAGELRESAAPFDGALETQRLLATEDGRMLVQAFLGIEDTAVRRKLVELATATAAMARRPNAVRRTRRSPPRS